MTNDHINRQAIVLFIALLIPLAFAAGRLTNAGGSNDARAEAVAIGEYRGGHAAEARPLFERLAEHGDATAAYFLGAMYQYGDGVERDAGKAVKWLSQAAEAGNIRGARQLGLLYLAGRDQVQDLAAARHWLRQAAAGGDAEAMRHLGDMNAVGLGAAPDPVAAYADYAAAATLGDPVAARRRDDQAGRLSAAQQTDGEQQARQLVQTDKPAAPPAMSGSPATTSAPTPLPAAASPG